MGSLETWRDIALIVLTLEGIIFITLLVVMTAGFVWVVGKARKYVQEYIGQAMEVTHTMRSTALDLSRQAAEPIITVSATGAAVRSSLKALIRKVKREDIYA
jgi:hypothetical protein